MADLEITVGRVYRAKRPTLCGTLLRPTYNDRMVIWIDKWGESLQYDSATIKTGGKYRCAAMADFKKWAGKDVTDTTPEGDWEAANG